MKVFAEAQTLALASFTLFPTHKVATTSSQDEDTGLRGNQGEVDEMKHEVKGGRPLQGPSNQSNQEVSCPLCLGPSFGSVCRQWS